MNAVGLSRFRFMLRLITVVFAIEFAIMFVLPMVIPEGSPWWVEAILDPTLLALASGPVLWRLLFSKLRTTLDELARIETDAHTHRQEVEYQRLALEDHTIVSRADARGRITWVNDSFCRISGYSREELIGKDHRVLSSGHHPKEFWAEMYSTLRTRGVWRSEVKNKAKDGSYYWVDATNAVVRDAHGRIQQFVSIRVDSTERKRIEEALQSALTNGPRMSSASFLHQALESLSLSMRVPHALIARIDSTSEGQVRTIAVRANRRSADDFAYPLAGSPFEHALEARAPWQITDSVLALHPDDAYLSRIHAMSCIGVPLIAQSGTVLGLLMLLDTVPRPDFQDFPSAFLLCATRFASELDRMRLEEQVSSLSRAVESSADAVIVSDRSHRIAYVNPAFTTLTGFSAADVLGREPNVLTSASCDPDIQREVEATLRNGATWSGRIRCRRREGVDFWAQDTITPIRDEAGSIAGHVAVRRDITDQVTRENANEEARLNLERAKAEADAANRAKTEFLANVSHEIRTPMNGVVGMIEHLLSTQLDASQREAALTAKSSAGAMVRVLDEILEVSKLEAGDIMIDPRPFDVREWAAEISTLMSPSIHEKGIEFVVRVAEPVPRRLIGDAGHVRQVTMHLLDNALRFTNEGVITLEVQEVATKAGSSRVRFLVSDTGIGIPMARQERIFDEFEQADNSSTRRHGGLGLGLPIAKRLVRLMKGEIGVRSQEGKGTTFSFVLDLPIAEAASSATPVLQSAVTSPPIARPVRVLLAEDNPVNQKVAKRMLEKLGCKTDVAANGKIALDLLEANRYDLVLMDCHMPEMDGFEATRAIRSRSDTAATLPIVAVTASASADDIERCRTAGMNDVIAKPIDSRLLARAVAAAANGVAMAGAH